MEIVFLLKRVEVVENRLIRFASVKGMPMAGERGRDDDPLPTFAP